MRITALTLGPCLKIQGQRLQECRVCYAFQDLESNAVPNVLATETYEHLNCFLHLGAGKVQGLKLRICSPGCDLLRESGVRSITEIGWLTAIPNLVAAAGMVLIARRSDARRERRWHVAFPALLGAVGLLGSVVFSHQLVLVLVFLSLAALGVMSALPVQWSFLTAFLSGSSAAAAIGLVNSVGNLGGIVSPMLIGWLKDQTQSLDAGMYAIAACVAASALIALSYPARLVDR
jgi:MFS family permease